MRGWGGSNGKTETDNEIVCIVEVFEGVCDDDLDEEDGRHAERGHDRDPEDVPLCKESDRSEKAEFKSIGVLCDRFWLSEERRDKQRHRQQGEDAEPHLPSNKL